MVDGVHGDLDLVVRHVVVEQRIILECVIILNLHVEEKSVMAPVFIYIKISAMTFAVHVR